MKILFFTGAMGRGGAERVISILSDYYAQKGWEVKIATVLHSQVEYQLNPKVEVVDLSFSKGIKFGFFQTVSNIKKFIKAEKPDAIISFMAQICLVVGLAIGKTAARVIMSERIDPSQVKRNYFYRKLLDKTYQKADIVVLQTQRAKAYFNEKIRQKSVIIANPIKVYADTDMSKHRIVTAGRMTSQKNHRMLISAFAEIHKAHPEYTLTVYGDGPLRLELEKQISELGLEDVIDFPGNVTDLHKRISDAEIFVLPSNFEGLSNALLEAMMMGFPVISTDCAGSDEVIENKQNGILIPVGDDKKLIDAIETVICDSELRRKLSKNAKKSVEYCKVDNIISEWSNVIEK